MNRQQDNACQAKRAVIYLRVAHGAKPAAIRQQLVWQRAHCEAVAKVYGLVVVKEYCDIGCATDLEQRPELRQLLAEVQADDFRYVIVADLARLSRNVRQLTAIENQLAQVGVTLLVYGEGPIQSRARSRIATILADFELAEARRA